MATPPNDDSRMLFKLLSDGEWHSYEEIRDRLAATVPPGRALRKYQERVEYARRTRDEAYESLRSEDEQIFYGQRSVAQSTITSWKGRGIMVNGSAALKQIRIRPGFKSWGLEVPDVPEEPGQEEGERESAGEAEKPQQAPAMPEVPQEVADLDRPPEQGPEPVADPEDEVPAYAGPVREAYCDECCGPCLDRPDSDPETLAKPPSFYARDPQVTPLGLPSLPWICPRCEKQNDGTTCERCGITPVYGSQALRSQPPTQPRAQPLVEPPSEEMLLTSANVPAKDYQWPPLQPVTKAAEHRRCDDCGLLMSDEAKHADWHSRYIARSAQAVGPELALFAESEIRTLMGDVVAKHLDDFQAGMERYLSEQFRQLEALIKDKKPPQAKWRNQR